MALRWSARPLIVLVAIVATVVAATALGAVDADAQTPDFVITAEVVDDSQIVIDLTESTQPIGALVLTIPSMGEPNVCSFDGGFGACGVNEEGGLRVVGAKSDGWVAGDQVAVLEFDSAPAEAVFVELERGTTLDGVDLVGLAQNDPQATAAYEAANAATSESSWLVYVLAGLVAVLVLAVVGGLVRRSKRA